MLALASLGDRKFLERIKFRESIMALQDMMLKAAEQGTLEGGGIPVKALLHPN
jgi:nitroreductase